MLPSITGKDLKTGDILHCKSNRLLGKIIRWVTKSKFASHSAVVVECWGQIYIVDAQKNGINPKPLKAWLNEYKYDVVVARLKLGPKDPKAFSIRAFTKVGLTGYDFGSLIFKHPWKAITGKWRKQRKPEDKMICSEYVAWLYHIEDAERISPHDLYNHTHARASGFVNYKLEYVNSK